MAASANRFYDAELRISARLTGVVQHCRVVSALPDCTASSKKCTSPNTTSGAQGILYIGVDLHMLHIDMHVRGFTLCQPIVCCHRRRNGPAAQHLATTAIIATGMSGANSVIVLSYFRSRHADNFQCLAHTVAQGPSLHTIYVTDSLVWVPTDLASGRCIPLTRDFLESILLTCYVCCFEDAWQKGVVGAAAMLVPSLQRVLVDPTIRACLAQIIVAFI